MCLRSAVYKSLKSKTSFALAVLLGGVLASSASAQISERALLGSTPLILKDGRIANVSVHTFAFPGGASELATPAARELAVLTYDVATDCFLTAQVIGHVGPSEVSGNDTLNAHRLARARADAVQASLINGGLPAKAIASVWDWQFMVREPRATLWLFRLVEGEDCEGTPLESRASLQVARSQPASEDGAAGRRSATASSEAGRDMTELANRATQRMSADERAAEPSEATADSRGAAAVPAGPAPTESVSRASQVTQTVPASTTRDAGFDDRGQGAAARAEDGAGAGAAREPRQQTARAQPERAASEAAADRALVVQFANNSSYFPPGIRAELEALVDSLEPGRRYDVTLRVTVSDSTQVVGAKTAKEAAKYNKWLAKRRLERVQSWLDSHARNADLAIETEFVDGDGRQVQVEVAPAA